MPVAHAGARDRTSNDLHAIGRSKDMLAIQSKMQQVLTGFDANISNRAVGGFAFAHEPAVTRRSNE